MLLKYLRFGKNAAEMSIKISSKYCYVKKQYTKQWEKTRRRYLLIEKKLENTGARMGIRPRKSLGRFVVQGLASKFPPHTATAFKTTPIK